MESSLPTPWTELTEIESRNDQDIEIFPPVLIRGDEGLNLVRIIGMDLEVQEDVSLQKMDGPAVLLAFFELPHYLWVLNRKVGKNKILLITYYSFFIAIVIVFDQ